MSGFAPGTVYALEAPTCQDYETYIWLSHSNKDYNRHFMQHLERALDGQNQFWKYLVMVIAVLIGAQLVGAIPLGVVIAYNGLSKGARFDPNNITDFSAYGISSTLGLALLVIPFMLSLIAMALLLNPLHKRSLAETINGTRNVRWSRALFAAGVWFSLMVIYLLIAYCTDPGNFQFRFNLSSFIPLVMVSVLLIPFQSGFEEVLFRGYLAQGFAAWTRNRWVVIIVPSALFALMHMANPEVKEFGFWLAMPQYLLLGLVLGLVSTLDDGIETAIGAHAANNVFASIFVTYKSSVLQTGAVFNQLQVDPVKETWATLAICVAFVAILARKYKWSFSTLNGKVQTPITQENGTSMAQQY